MLNYFRRLRLLFWTVRYLTFAQVRVRGSRVMRRRWWRLRGRRVEPRGLWTAARTQPLLVGLKDITVTDSAREDVKAALSRARDISAGRFCFLNECVDMGQEPAWHDGRQGQLWRYHLHYFDYVGELLVWSATSGSQDAYRTFRSLVNSWVEGNQKIEGDGWHPYTISVRLVNWLHAATAFEAQLEADERFRLRLLESIYTQSQFLASELELDVRGNHLLKNLRALIWAGLSFEGEAARGWLEKAFSLFERELQEQVLDDGGHFERSPGYHLAVLRDCLEIGLWLRRNGQVAPPGLDEATRRMLDYLMAILPPDGQVPLLKDTAWDAAPEALELLVAGALYFDEPAYKRGADFGLYPLLLFGASGREKFDAWPLNTKARGSLALRASGHYVMRDEAAGEYLIFDAGAVCPDYLPAHAQADMLTYELMVDGQRVVVDSGVYEYKEGPWRDYFRSTRAHNTVEVAGENQSEVWSSFRVARRARPGHVFWLDNGDFVSAQGEHDGYRRLPRPLTHRRTIVWRRNQFWLFIDELLGNGYTEADSYIHLHPELNLEPVTDTSWRINGTRGPLWLTAFGQQSHSIIRGRKESSRQGWYSERFGQLRDNAVLALHGRGALPRCFGYCIARGAGVQVKAVKSAEGYDIDVIREGTRHSFGLTTDTGTRVR